VFTEKKRYYVTSIVK